GERLGEHLLRPAQRYSVLRTRGSGDAGLNSRKVELDPLRIARLNGLVMPKALLFGIGLHQLAKLLRTAGEPKVAKRLGVDGEDRHRRAVLGRHVPDRRPVLERVLGDAWPVTFDELAYDAVAAEKLGDGEHEVGRRRALR